MTEPPRLQVSARMKALMSYDKLAGERPRMLVLRSEYWLDGACLNAAERLGWQTASAPVVMEGVMSREHVARLLETLIELRPDFVLSVNLSGMDVDGLFARLFEDLEIPYVTWFVDDPRTILMGRRLYASPYAVALTWERAYAAYLREMGFPVVTTMPLAVDPTLFDGAPPERWDFPPTFVGNSMADFAEREWDWARAHPECERMARAAFDEGRVTRERFAGGVGAILGEAAAAGLDAEAARHLEMLFFIEGTRRLRRALAETLTPEGLELRGDEGWAAGFPANARGPVHYTDGLSGFYRGCELNVNTTSIQMATTVNQRVFDCPAAGGFLLTDRQTALDELFDVEREVAAYGSREECRDLFRFYRSRPQARRAIVERARKRILGEHTYAHRLQAVAAIVREHYGGAPATPR